MLSKRVSVLSHLSRVTRRKTFALMTALMALCANGCGNVAVYERAKLAHFTMDPSDATSVGQEHVYAIHEGAMGGTVGATSGCGCN